MANNPCTVDSAEIRPMSTWVNYMVTATLKSAVPTPFVDGVFTYPTGPSAVMTQTNGGKNSIIVVITQPDTLALRTTTGVVVQSGRMFYLGYANLAASPNTATVVAIASTGNPIVLVNSGAHCQPMVFNSYKALAGYQIEPQVIQYFSTIGT